MAGDHGEVVEVASSVSSAITLSLGDASTMGAGYTVTLKNSGQVAATIGRETSGNTIDGVAANVTLPPGWSMTFRVNSGLSGYITISDLSAINTAETGTTISATVSGDWTTLADLANIPAYTIFEYVVSITASGGTVDGYLHRGEIYRDSGVKFAVGKIMEGASAAVRFSGTSFQYQQNSGGAQNISWRLYGRRYLPFM